MAYTTIDLPTDYFNTVLYTGNGSSQTITGVGFQADFIWFKERSSAGEHKLNNSVLGTNNYLISNSTSGDDTTGSGIQSYNSDGYAVSNASNINDNTETYVTWNWLAGGSASSNTDGDITSSVSANTTAGFSIVSYTGSGTASDTVGHGLGVTPAMIIVKNRTEATSWCVAHKSLSTDKVLRLESTNGEGDIGDGELDSPPNNSSTFGFNNGTTGTPLKVVNESSDNYIAYCFAEKQGYSKFGIYTGNGNADGAFVYTGFKPSFLIVKATHSSTSESWLLLDSTRQPFNLNSKRIRPDNSGAEDTNAANGVDLLSNGFKIRTNDNRLNGNGQTLIYMAFGQSLVGSNNVPCTAR